MAIEDPWPIIHAERAALAADLEPLSEERWSTPSMCGQWTVLDVLGHMTATARMTPPRFFVHLARSRFSFEKLSASDVARETEGGPAATLARFREVLTSTDHPPGPTDTWLGETIVHAEDIRRPLGLDHSYPMEALVRVADFYKRSNLLIGAKKRIAGLRLRAVDANWATGAGPEVVGPMRSLVLAMTGRRPALDDLSGDGLAALRSRF